MAMCSKMSNCVTKNLLKVLHDTKRDTRKAVWEKANKKLIDIICECLHRILKGNLKSSPEVHRTLKRHQKEIREIMKENLMNKKHLLNTKMAMIHRCGAKTGAHCHRLQPKRLIPDDDL